MMNNNYWNIFVIIVFLWFDTPVLLQGSSTEKSVTVSENVRLSCQTNSEAGIRWTHTYEDGFTPNDVYMDGSFQPGYTERFRLDQTVSGAFDLLIEHVKFSDAGEYVCLENDGKKETTSVILEVEEDGVKDLPIIPVDTTVIAGQDVRLNCSSAYYKNVWWTRYQVGSTTLEPIYYGYVGLVNGYKSGGRHSVEADDAAGHYNLLIKNVQPSDAGRYQCIDQSGLGKTAQAELIVLESSPTCSSNVQPDGVVSDDLEFCGFSPDEISMSCGVKFAGNIPPVLEWKEMSTGAVIPSDITVDTSTAFEISMGMKLTSKVNLEDIVCHTTLHGKSHISCRKPNPKQIYLSNATKLDRTLTPRLFNCSADTNQLCEYIWERNNQVVAQTSVLNASQPGDYRCRADCMIRDRQCTVYPLRVTFEVDNYFKNCFKLPFLALLLIPLLLIAIIVIFVLRRKRKLNRQRDIGTYTLERRAVTERTNLMSLTLFQSKLYAVFKSCNVVSVFQSSPPFKREQDIVIKEMSTPVDIEGHEKFRCIYVSDSTNRCIWKISFNILKSPTITRFLENLDCSFKFSVSPTGKIVLVKERSGDTPSSIEVYSETGKPLKSIILQSETESLQHAVWNPNNRLIVSFGGRVGEVDKNGNILLCYPPLYDPPFHTEAPWHVVIKKHNRVFIPQYENNKIQLLDNDFKDIVGCINLGSQPNSHYLQKYIINKDKLYVGLQSGDIYVAELPIPNQDVEMHEFEACSRQPLMSTQTSETKSEDTEMAKLRETLRRTEEELAQKNKDIENYKSKQLKSDSLSDND